MVSYIKIWSASHNIRIGIEFVVIDPDSLGFGDGDAIITLDTCNLEVTNDHVRLAGYCEPILGDGTACRGSDDLQDSSAKLKD